MNIFRSIFLNLYFNCDYMMRWYRIFILLRINIEVNVIIFRSYSNREAFIETLLYPDLRRYCLYWIYCKIYKNNNTILLCLIHNILFIINNNISIIPWISFKSSHSKFISIKFKKKSSIFRIDTRYLYFHPFRANKIHWSCCRRTTECAASAYTKT